MSGKDIGFSALALGAVLSLNSCSQNDQKDTPPTLSEAIPVAPIAVDTNGLHALEINSAIGNTWLAQGNEWNTTSATNEEQSPTYDDRNWFAQDSAWDLTFETQPLLDYAGNSAPFVMYKSNPSSLHEANTIYRSRLRIGFGLPSVVDETPRDYTINPKDCGCPFHHSRFGTEHIFGVYGEDLSPFNIHATEMTEPSQHKIDFYSPWTFPMTIGSSSSHPITPNISLSGEYDWRLLRENSQDTMTVHNWEKYSGRGNTLGTNFYFY